MGTLVFSAIGTLVGGPIGGAIGAVAGRQVDSLIMGGGNRKGPRLKELDVTTSSYGTPIARHFGRMRVPGTVIWSTDLDEHSRNQGGGKGSGSITTYSYSVSFAVALSSRPIMGIGRIWADGRLLRGEAGDLKVDGEMRIHNGTGDQAPDPLIAEIEGADRCPAYRGLAYVVFEDLDLSDFYNRVPSLTFEVIADETFTLQSLFREMIADVDAHVAIEGIDGISCEGPLVETLQALAPLYPMDADSGAGMLTIARERLQPAPALLPEAATAVGDDEFGQGSGASRSRAPRAEQAGASLRYYDTGRDYLPGIQHTPGKPAPGRPPSLEVPAAMTAQNARRLAEGLKQRSDWSRDRLSWRTTELDPAIGPGAIVVVPGHAGRWRVREWEWRAQGIELLLERVVPTGADEHPATPTDPGRYNPPVDAAPAPSRLIAFELPWAGTGSAGAPLVFAAVSSVDPSWSGAALFAGHGDGELVPLGPSGRARSVIGTASSALPPAGPMLLDTMATVEIELLSPDMSLAGTHARGLATGNNLALLGDELIQFAQVEPVGAARWRLSGLLRGRGGTEAAIATHLAGERFVLVDHRPVALNPARLGDTHGAQIVAAGRGDPDPVMSAIALAGITLRPPSPVHPRAETGTDGSLHLSWTRRSRDGWYWRDGVDAPLVEQSELYRVSYGLSGFPADTPIAAWNVGLPQLTLSPVQIGELNALLSGGEFHVRQVGSHALSLPLRLTAL